MPRFKVTWYHEDMGIDQVWVIVEANNAPTAHLVGMVMLEPWCRTLPDGEWRQEEVA